MGRTRRKNELEEKGRKHISRFGDQRVPRTIQEKREERLGTSVFFLRFWRGATHLVYLGADVGVEIQGVLEAVVELDNPRPPHHVVAQRPPPRVRLLCRVRVCVYGFVCVCGCVCGCVSACACACVCVCVVCQSLYSP